MIAWYIPLLKKRGIKITIKTNWVGAGNDKCLVKSCGKLRKNHSKKKDGHSFKEI
jgi:hypothetical protein